MYYNLAPYPAFCASLSQKEYKMDTDIQENES